MDQGVVFSNVPSDVHPAVCFYGLTKTVRLVELKRIDGESDSEVSDSDDESDVCGTTQHAEQVHEPLPLKNPAGHHFYTPGAWERGHAGKNQAVTRVGPASTSGIPTMTGVEGRKQLKCLQTRRVRRTAARRENDMAAAIQASVASSQSAGLLASLANFAQWHVPRNQGEPSREEQDTTEKQADGARAEEDQASWIASRQGNADFTSIGLLSGSVRVA